MYIFLIRLTIRADFIILWQYEKYEKYERRRSWQAVSTF